ncbi:RNA cytidine acetyltransferase [Penicillium sp. IBT 35674x]|nr:RNA cytidine acetyltransferase [Penicillium sp. IBT 35674x]
MPRKAIDSRIPALIRNGIQEKKRSFFVVVGDRAKDVIVNLHYIMSSVDVKQNKSVLWAYKKDLLGFTSHRKKREAKIKKEVKYGIREANQEDPFELFITLNQIRYVYYKETEKILGNTYGMCILQDFEAMTPNLLARTVETVEGGGIVLLLLKSMTSLKQLYTMSMDIHSRYRTEAHDDVVARFNERFILSLGSCASCLVVDDELNVLPISGGKNVKPLPPPGSTDESSSDKKKKSKDDGPSLPEIKESVQGTEPLSSFVNLAKTADQAKALLDFTDTITEKTLKSTVAMTAGRGRGKSAALGLAIATAIYHGYSNIFITSPSPENLKTLFEFVFKGFDALGYTDHLDYTILQSTNPDFNKAIVRVNIHRNHRQTIQYIQPQDAHVLGQAELLVIDEAAAIPLPLVRKLMGPYLIFMASTINGYEGTGRSLSLKLIEQLREQSRNGSKSKDTDVADRSTGKASKSSGMNLGGRKLVEIKLKEPIRYAPEDHVEQWLNNVLCLNIPEKSSTRTQNFTTPDKCQLLQVNRDTLFSFNPISEGFLQQMMSLYSASHYKNTPNDLQLMSDAPAHQLYVLLPPIDEKAKQLPDPLCVIQVALEGRISRQSVLNSLSRGQRAGGDLIPWLVSQQFQDEDFASLSGARIVRIATNPEHQGMGYGKHALKLLVDFFEGKFTSLDEDMVAPQEEMVRVTDEELANANLLDDDVRVRNIHTMPPLFSRLTERRPDALDYIGVSYGLTPALHKFWKTSSFHPVYLRQTPNELTGEHSCVMLRTLATGANDAGWLGSFCRDFHRRFLALLSYQFRHFPAVLSLSICESATAGSKLDTAAVLRTLKKADLDADFSPFDLKRLDSYANNLLDYHVIMDMIPRIADYYFSNRLVGKLELKSLQLPILLALGLQHKTMDELEKELDLPASQLLAIFLKTMRKFSKHFRGIVEGAVAESMPAEQKPAEPAGGAHDDDIIEDRFKPLDTGLDEELKEGGQQIDDEMREKQRALIDSLPLDKYAIDTGSAAWEDAEKQIRNGGAATVSVKSKPSKRKKGETAREIFDKEVDAKRQKMIKKGTEGRKK